MAQTEVKVVVCVFCDGNFGNESLSLFGQGAHSPFVWLKLVLLTLRVQMKRSVVWHMVTYRILPSVNTAQSERLLLEIV